MESIDREQINRRATKEGIRVMREANTCTAAPEHKPLFLPGRTLNNMAVCMVWPAGILFQK